MVEKIKKIISDAVGKEIGQVLVSEKSEFGDYSTNAAFMLAKELKKPPLEVAKELAEKIKTADKGKIFSKVEAAPPGFVNFWISPKILQRELADVLKLKSYKLQTNKLKINAEFISANPTGPLTMANGRGGFLGDTIANVLEAVDHKVTREYYINDAGNQIKILGESVLAAIGKAESKEEHYRGDYIKELAKGASLKGSTEDMGRAAAKKLLAQIKKSVKNMGVDFDVWYSEYKNLRGGKGLIKKVLAILEKNGLVSEHDGAKWLKSSDPPTSGADEKDRVLVKSTGEPTYFLSDIAYHYDKFTNRKFDKAIVIWGADHHGYIARLKAGVKAIGVDPENLKIIITQLIRLVEGGKEVRMSKRKGEFITLDELIKEVGKDAARFFFLMQSPDTHMDFDLALAKEKSLKNPVYYVQYAYVRAGSILGKANRKASIANRLLEKLNSESEMNLMKELIKLPDVIQQTAEDYQVSRLTRYAMEIARAFHNFYEKERVIGEPREIMEARLALVGATQNILGRVFDILGIDKPKKM